MQTEIFLVRHGETDWNAQNRFQGQLDSPLTPKGIAQAEAAAAYLRPHTFHALYSSDLPRTLKTAQPIALAIGLTIIPEPALRERNLGIFEGLTTEEIETRHTAEYTRYKAREAEFVVPNGESLQQLHLRGLTVLERLARRHIGERVVVVSHGAVITTFLRHLNGIPLHLPSPFMIHNGSVSHVVFAIDHLKNDSGEWTIISQGETVYVETA